MSIVCNLVYVCVCFGIAKILATIKKVISNSRTSSSALPSSRKWIKKNRKTMMKIFFFNSIFFHLFNTRFFYYWMHRNLISMEDTSHFEGRHETNEPNSQRSREIVGERERTAVPNDPRELLQVHVYVCSEKKARPTNIEVKLFIHTTYDNAGNHSLKLIKHCVIWKMKIGIYIWIFISN